MKSLAELAAIREKALKDITLRQSNDGYKVVVGMATCGIAAGARSVMNAVVEELKKRNINNATVTMTGCIGVCRLEPIIDVIAPNGDKTTYVNMTPEKALQVVSEHIVNGQPVLQYAIGNADN